MSDSNRQAEARREVAKLLRSKRRLAHGAWFPAGMDAPTVHTTTFSAAPEAPAPAPRTQRAEPTPPRSAPTPPPSTKPTSTTARASAPATTKPVLDVELLGGVKDASELFTVKGAPLFATHGSPRPATPEARAAELAQLSQHAQACRRCVLGNSRTQAVFGVGNPETELMFVGEGPGQDEDEQGEPFVGRAGQRLNSLIEKLGFKRSDIYIGNVVKCRPPENRTPAPEEGDACSPYLWRQIEIIAPRIIIALGLVATQNLLRAKGTMGQFRKNRYRIGEILVIPTYHPAYVLRTPKAAWDVWDDVKDVPQLLGRG